MLDGVGGGGGLQQRHRVRQTDVLARMDDQPTDDEARVLPRLEHPCQPEQRGIRIGAPDRLDEGADDVVVGIALPVVHDGLALHRVGNEVEG